MWTVLGCQYDQAQHMCMSQQSSFTGYLSQVNWYKRRLTFRSSPGLPSEIAYNFANPRHIFEETSVNPLMYVVLVWNEYELESGVNRIIPSEAQGKVCDAVDRSPQCSHFAGRCLNLILQNFVSGVQSHSNRWF